MMIANEIIEIYAIDGDSSILLGVVTDIYTTIEWDVVIPVYVANVSYTHPHNNIEGKITASASSFEKAFKLKKANGEEYGIFN